ncbi:MAG: RsmE family RNA methyltransferase, partial [Clostridia bacterium]|nr:RsmE family RNA methyltransferase [Clostridia bacterium]
MRRFFVETQQIDHDLVTITGQDAKHLGKVLRLSSGDEIQVFDGSGVEYLVKITSVKPSQATGIVLGRQQGSTEPPLKVNLVQALPKQGK